MKLPNCPWLLIDEFPKEKVINSISKIIVDLILIVYIFTVCKRLYFYQSTIPNSESKAMGQKSTDCLSAFGL